MDELTRTINHFSVLLEDKNAKLKRLLAEAMLDNAVLKDITSRKW